MVVYCFQEDEKLIDKTEGKVIEAFLCLVIKLSEALFRPMFFRVREFWFHFFPFLCNSNHTASRGAALVGGNERKGTLF